MSDYAQQWQEFRRLRRRMMLLFLGGMVVGGTALAGWTGFAIGFFFTPPCAS